MEDAIAKKAQLLGLTVEQAWQFVFRHDPIVTMREQDKHEESEEEGVPPTATIRDRDANVDDLTPNFNLLTPESQLTPAADMVIVDDLQQEQH